MTEIVMNEKLEEIRNYNAYQLSDLADCQGPDNRTSAGALFLISVLDAVFDAYEYNNGVIEDENDFAWQIADNAPSIYTYTLWAQFIDLGAYQEEPDSGEWPTILDNIASVALYQIAERLVYALLAEINEAVIDEDNRTDVEVDEYFVSTLDVGDDGYRGK